MDLAKLSQMSDTSNIGTQYKGQAILLISGLGNLEVISRVIHILNTYQLRIAEQQNISMAGRLIACFRLELDPAHIDAIEDELVTNMKPFGLDVAIDSL